MYRQSRESNKAEVYRSMQQENGWYIRAKSLTLHKEADVNWKDVRKGLGIGGALGVLPLSFSLMGQPSVPENKQQTPTREVQPQQQPAKAAPVEQPKTEQAKVQQATPQQRNAIKRLIDHIVRAVKGWVVRTLSKYDTTYNMSRRVAESLTPADILYIQGIEDVWVS